MIIPVIILLTVILIIIIIMILTPILILILILRGAATALILQPLLSARARAHQDLQEETKLSNTVGLVFLFDLKCI